MTITNLNLLELVSSSQVLTVYLVLFLVLLLLYGRTFQKKYKLPPGPTGMPILGYVPFLGREPFKKLNELKNKYGNVFSLRKGSTRVVILCDYEAVLDVYSKPSSNGRPHGFFDFLPDAIGFLGSSGKEWLEQRKFCIKSMREQGAGRDKWEWILQREVDDFVNFISSFNGEPLDWSETLMSSISSNLTTVFFGERLPFYHPDRRFLHKAIKTMLMLVAKISSLTYFSTISRICAALGIGGEVEAHETMVLFTNFLREKVDKIKESFKSSDQDSLIADYLKEMDDYKGKTGHYFNEKNLFGNIRGMFLAGSHTVTACLSWLFLAMAKYPDIQVKVQQEIDSVLDKDECIQWSAKHKLPYTYATIMEGQRWRSVSYLGVIRMAAEDIQVHNYDIPKGTLIIANFWALNNDPRYWKEPDKFEPRRFLTTGESGQITKPDSYIPFSYGKRNCPGEVVAMMEILIYFTSVMQKFTIRVPKGKILNLDLKIDTPSHPYSQQLQFVPREN